MTSNLLTRARISFLQICAFVMPIAGTANAANEVQITTMTNPAAPEAGKIIYTSFSIVNKGPEALETVFLKLTLPGGHLAGCNIPASMSNTGTPFLMTGQFSLAVGASKTITVTWTAFSPGTYTMDSEIGWRSASGETGLPKYPISTTVAADSGTDLPSVALNSPTHGGTYAAGSSILLEAAVDDRGTGTGDRFGVAKVEFYAGATKIGEDTVKPYAINWPNVPAGTYALTAVAIDDDASASQRTSLPVNIAVAGGAENQVPVMLSDPWSTPNPVRLSAK